MARQTWLRCVHFQFIVFFTGLAYCLLNIALPDFGIEAFGAAESCRLAPIDGPSSIAASECNSARGRVSVYTGISAGLKAFAGLVMGPALGSASDIHGRKFWVVASQLCSLVSAVPLLYPAGATPFGIYLVLNALSGLLPALPALLAVVADDQTPEHRARGFGLLLAVFDTSFLIVPVFLSRISLELTSTLVCMSSALSLVFSLLYGESLPLEQRVRPEETAAHLATRKWWRPDQAASILISSPVFRRLSVVIFANILVSAGGQQCFLLFLETSYGLHRTQAGAFLAALAISSLIIQALLLPYLVRYLGLCRTLFLGIVLQVVQQLLYLAVHRQFAVGIACVLGGFASMVFPSVSALKANAAPEDEQGRVQGAVSGLQNFAMGLGPLIYGPAFALLSQPSPFDVGPQAVYGLSVAVLLPAVYVAWTLERYVKEHRRCPNPRQIMSEGHTCEEPVDILPPASKVEVPLAQRVAVLEAVNLPGSIDP